MMKRTTKLGIIVAVLVLVLSAFALTACNDTSPVYNEELVTNGGFETFDSTTKKFEGWSSKIVGESSNSSLTMYTHSLTSGGVAVVNGENDSTYGTQYMRVANTVAGSAYFYQTIPVVRGATYRVTYSVFQNSAATAGSDGVAVGAHLCFLENTDEIFDEQFTYGEWTDVTVYVKPKNTDNLTLCLRVGTEAAPTVATAYFDKVSMQRMDAIPSSATVTTLQRHDTVTYNKNLSGTLFVSLVGVLAAAILVVAYVGLRRLFASKYAFIDSTSENGFKKLFRQPVFVAICLCAFAFVIRLVFALTMFGFGAETSAFIAKAEGLIANGLPKFYSLNEGDLTSPGMLYVLSIIGGLGKAFGFESGSMNYAILLKMPAIVCDMAAVLVLYLFGRKHVGNKVAAIYALIYATLPAAFVLSGLRGSDASMLATLLLLVFVFLVEKKNIAVFVTYTFALLLSVDALAVAPLLLSYYIYLCYKSNIAVNNADVSTTHNAVIERKKNILLTVLGPVCVIIAWWLLSLPFTIDFLKGEDVKVFFIIGKYRDMIASITYFVSNNFNLYGMVGMNNKIVNNTASVFNLIFILVLCVYIISLYLKNRNRLEIMLLGSFTMAIISVFTLKHTETYMFLSLALLLAYIMVAGEKRLYVVFIGLSVLNFLNVAQLMSISGFVAPNPTGAVVNFESLEVFYIMMSVFTVLFALYYGYLTYSICNNGKRRDIPAMPQKFLPTTVEWFKSWKR